MIPARWGAIRHGLGVIVVLLAVASESAAGQLRGTVTDAGGRALPFATVVSRTGNGFLAVRAGLHGEFAFPGRPHRPGHTITVTAAGYGELTYRLQAGDSVIALSMVRDHAGLAPGWAVGLPRLGEVAILAADGRELRPGRDTLVTGAPYRVQLLMATEAGCLRPGPSAVDVAGQEVVVAQAVFVRGGDDCDMAEAVMPEIRFTAPGANPSVRVVGRYGDAVVDFRSGR